MADLSVIVNVLACLPWGGAERLGARVVIWLVVLPEGFARPGAGPLHGLAGVPALETGDL